MGRMHQGHTARKRFGQNFLVDKGVINAIVAAIAPQQGDRLVEIGPGLAALTAPLLECLGEMHVVEIDRDIVARLKQRFPPAKLHIHAGDALAFDFAALAAQLGGPLRVAGNLPYNISSPLLFHLADQAQCIRDMHFMLQHEVVERMVAEAGSAAYGRLSVMLQYRFRMAYLFQVPPSAFEPAPKVDSAIVRMEPKPEAERTARDEALLAKVVSAAFAMRRKMLRNTLKDFLSEDRLQALGVCPTQRAEDLSVDAYVRIANHLADQGFAQGPA